MNIGRGIAVSAVALAALGWAPAWAQMSTFAHSGVWEAYGGLGENNQPVCGMTQRTEDRFLGIKFYRGDESFMIYLGSKQWHLKEDAKYPLSFEIDRNGDWSIDNGGASASLASDGSAYLQLAADAKDLNTFVREFRSGSQMRIKFPTVEAGGWTLSLTGSSAISDVFERCRRLQTASDSVLGQPMQRCFKTEGSTPDQRIEGCTAVIATQLWTGKDAATPLYRRTLAYELKGDYEHQLADANEAVRVNPDAFGAYFSRARAHFFQADFSAAAADFSKVVELTDDPYSMLWRFLARHHVGPQAANELAAGAAKLGDKDWPYAVVDFYLGRRTADEMRAAASGPEEKCEAAFYLAEWHLLHMNGAEAKPLLQMAADTCPEGFFEWTGAQIELKRLGQ